MLPAPFMMAFEGIRDELTRKVDVSSRGLLLKLQDRKVIDDQERQRVKVAAQVLRDFCFVGLILYIVLHTYCFAFVSLSLLHEFILYFVLPLNCSITVYW